jgi:hypothetical protein
MRLGIISTLQLICGEDCSDGSADQVTPDIVKEPVAVDHRRRERPATRRDHPAAARRRRRRNSRGAAEDNAQARFTGVGVSRHQALKVSTTSRARSRAIDPGRGEINQARPRGPSFVEGRTSHLTAIENRDTSHADIKGHLHFGPCGAGFGRRSLLSVFQFPFRRCRDRFASGQRLVRRVPFGRDAGVESTASEGSCVQCWASWILLRVCCKAIASPRPMTPA